MSHIGTGLIGGSAAPAGSKFRAVKSALSPSRDYWLNDASSGGAAFDHGSQQVNGTYNVGSGGISPSLVPGVKNETAFNGSGGGLITVPNTGLMTGAQAWTIAQLFIPTLYNVSVCTPLSVNGVGFLYGTNNFELFYPTGALTESTGQVLHTIPVYFFGTYDGTTIKWYAGNGNAMLLIASGAVALNLVAASSFIGPNNAGAYIQDTSIWVGTALNTTQMQSLVTALLGH